MLQAGGVLVEQFRNDTIFPPKVPQMVNEKTDKLHYSYTPTANLLIRPQSVSEIHRRKLNDRIENSHLTFRELLLLLDISTQAILNIS